MVNVLQKIDELIWGAPLLALLLGTGVWLTWCLKFLPVRKIGFALRCALGFVPENVRVVSKDCSLQSAGKVRGISPIASFSAELAATIGTGNIIGVATAILLGGPGALFWMVVASFFSLAIKLVESALSVKYHSYNLRGERVGGPMYVMRSTWGKMDSHSRSRFGTGLAFLYAFFAVGASLGMGNMVQANAISEALYTSFALPPAQTGLIITIVVILVLLGGVQSIAKVTRVLVPAMGIFYLLGTFGVLYANKERLPQAVGLIIRMAFQPGAISGGTMGNIMVFSSMSVMHTIRMGVSRGVFSNEAGLGAGGITAAATETQDPVRQGYISMLGVVVDTMIICVITGLAFLSSETLWNLIDKGSIPNGAELTVAVFQQTYGENGSVFVSISIAMFAFATIIAWAYQGERAFEFLFHGRNVSMAYRFIYSLCVFFGAVSSFQGVWCFSDICNGLMAIPNLIMILILSLREKGICTEIREYEYK